MRIISIITMVTIVVIAALLLVSLLLGDVIGGKFNVTIVGKEPTIPLYVLDESRQTMKELASDDFGYFTSCPGAGKIVFQKDDVIFAMHIPDGDLHMLGYLIWSEGRSITCVRTDTGIPVIQNIPIQTAGR